ncbi:MAG: cytochrome c3 family protein [Syntrophales bacterium]|nr:cytochrome c3 family protein [Syntrophales bacterium]
MKTKVLFSAVLSLVILMAFVLVTDPFEVKSAQNTPFLADRHTAKGLSCGSCHKESPPKDLVKTEICLSCHGDYNKLAAKTQKVEPNPHQSHEGDLACESCHHGHKPPENHCVKCHATFTFQKK